MKVGLVGLGYWGNKVLGEYKILLKENLIKDLLIYDSDELKLSNTAKEFGVKSTDSLSQLLESVDSVHICTPNHTHYDLIMRAFDNNLNVLVEKPITDDSNKGSKTIELALAKGLIYQVGNIFRFANSIKITKDIIKSGRLGRLKHINILWGHLARSDNSNKVDVLWDLLPHLLDILNCILESWPLSINNVSSTFDSTLPHLRKQADIILSYDQDLLVNVWVSLITHKNVRHIELHGINGSLVVDPVKQTVQMVNNGVTTEIEVNQNNTIRDEILNFIKCVKEKRNEVNSAYIGEVIVRYLESIIKWE